MNNITYEQFAYWCEKWNYTIEEGYRAMCFTANIIGQNFGNCIDYAKEVSNDNTHTNEFKTLVETIKNNAGLLINLYGRLDDMVFDMLKKHDKEAN